MAGRTDVRCLILPPLPPPLAHLEKGGGVIHGDPSQEGFCTGRGVWRQEGLERKEGRGSLDHSQEMTVLPQKLKIPSP